MRLFTVMCLCLLGFVMLQVFCVKQNDGFSVRNISANRPNNSVWEPRPLSGEEKVEVEKALAGPFTYFGCGGQAFVFFSADQNYVLKVFKQGRLKKSKKKLLRDYTSYKIACEELQNETGVVYAHLSPTDFWQRKLQLIDSLHHVHSVDVDQLDFLIQKRAQPVVERISELMQNGKRAQAEKTIRHALGLIVRLNQKGLSDRDPNICTNCGFIDDTPVKIDVGHFRKSAQDEDVSKKLEKAASPLRGWLGEHYPELIPFLEEELQKW